MLSLRSSGHLLLWVGFFAGAYITVAQVEDTTSKWSTIHWPLYVVALAVGVTGVVILRATQRQKATHSEKIDADIKILEASVGNLLAEIAHMLKDSAAINVFDVHKRIDANLMEDVGNFVAARQTLIHTVGLQSYADIMTDFSVAERNINRAWSASADGYIDEVWLCMQTAETRLKATANRLAEGKKSLVGKQSDPST